jgi:hypothetical protein
MRVLFCDQRSSPPFVLPAAYDPFARRRKPVENLFARPAQGPQLLPLWQKFGRP